VLIALGFAWATSASDGAARMPLYAAARAVREAANDLLPFSQIGGLLFGVKVLTDAGVPAARAYAATMIDLTTEMASQVLLVLAGVAISIDLVVAPTVAPHVQTAIWYGIALLGASCAALLLLRKPMLALAERMACKMVPKAGARVAEVRAELARFEAGRFALLPSFLWNALAWLLSVFSVWVALVLIGQPLPAYRVLALEALISVVRSGAFFVPAALGVQEVGYVLLATVVGLDPHAAMALSLLKRARDVIIGVPTLLWWQTHLVRRRAGDAKGERR
jgi:putative membrane protein